MRIIYTIAIFFYVILIRFAATIGVRNARLWLLGRRQHSEKYKQVFDKYANEKWIWFHVSSLGEFEQGRSVIEKLKHNHSQYKILLTFFSPSGYEVQKHYQHADAVLYFPIDFKGLVRKILNLVNPVLVIFVKYDFWFNFLRECTKKKIPVIFISSFFRPRQYFFKPFGFWFLEQIKKNVSMFFVQDQRSVVLLKQHGIDQVLLAGDTRIDRVIRIRDEQVNFVKLEEWIANNRVIIAGSTWPKDERILKEASEALQNVLFIIAPHQVSNERLSSIENLFGVQNICRLSNFSSNTDFRFLLIDTIGLLAKLYRYGNVIYIGNGFGKGIHNILEAVVYGKPVIFGPKYHKFPEAAYLVDKSAAFPIKNVADFIIVTEKLLNNNSFYKRVSNICLEYVEQNKGATNIIVNFIEKLYLKS